MYIVSILGFIVLIIAILKAVYAVIYEHKFPTWEINTAIWIIIYLMEVSKR